jgi:hypothetical protein
MSRRAAIALPVVVLPAPDEPTTETRMHER